MKIFFDHQVFSLHNHGGVCRYFSELIAGINQTTDNEAFLPMLFSNNIHLKEKGFDIKEFLSKYTFGKKVRLLYELNKYYTLPVLKNKPYDILHPTYYDPYFIPYLNRRPLVVTFHDMIHEKFSHQFKELTYAQGIIKRKRQLAQQADRIIAVSENTKRDIVDLLNIDPAKIEVIYHGSSFRTLSDSSADEGLSASKPYLLFVGGRTSYKNFGGMLDKIHTVLKRHNLTLICAGGGAFTSAETTYIDSLGIAHLVDYRPINDQVLPDLYSHALAFIFPSLYEGFGIPLLEAFACNCPCIINNASSLPEVAGDAALYVDFDDPNSLENAVERVLQDTLLRQQLIQKGQKQLKKFSWENTVAKTLKVYESLV